jgi:hypothetical protein
MTRGRRQLVQSLIQHMHELALSRLRAAKLETSEKILLKKRAHCALRAKTPFPTMAGATGRIDDFTGNEQAYVRYLEAEVARLRQQQQHPGVLDHSTTAQSENHLHLSSARIRWRPSDGVRQRHGLEIRHWKPGTRKPQSSTPAWKRHAEVLVKKTPPAREWWSTLREQGIYEVMRDGTAIAFLLGDETSPPAPRRGALEQDMSDAGYALLNHVACYARGARQRQMTASIAVRLANFQQILVLSACAVLRAIATPRIPEERILYIVKICLGDVSDDYCIRMLNTAVFINRLVDVLNAHGWDGRAGELLLWCQSSPLRFNR